MSYRLKDMEVAIEYLKKAYEASPEAEIAAHFGEVLWESGDTEEAISVWKGSYSEDAQSPILNETLKRYDVNFPEL